MNEYFIELFTNPDADNRVQFQIHDVNPGTGDIAPTAMFIIGPVESDDFDPGLIISRAMYELASSYDGYISTGSDSDFVRNV